MHNFQVGDRIRVKSIAEIMNTLDCDGCYEGLPFMPEMIEYCGKEFVVTKSAHKTCDTVNQTGGRSLPHTVHLDDLRCSGADHGGCDAICLLFWKEAWLLPASATQETELDSASVNIEPLESFALREVGIYRCQATQLPDYTSLLRWWDPRQYLLDLSSGNEKISNMIRFGFMKFIQNRIEQGYGFRLFLSIYNGLQDKLGGITYPSSENLIAKGKRTPTELLDLKVGEWVEVKSYEDIARTLDTDGKNRGMRFDIEMKPFCNRRFRVARKVTKILDEKTGKLYDMKTPSVILDGAVCEAKYSSCRMFCPRQIPSFWREIWLRRVPPGEIPLQAVNEESGS